MATRAGNESRLLGIRAAVGYAIPSNTLKQWRCEGKRLRLFKPRSRALYDVRDLDEFIRSSVLSPCAPARRSGMSLYKRGNVWYYLFYVDGKRYRGSTKTDNEKEADRIYARALAAAEAGESLKPRRAPLIQDFIKEFVEWVDQTTLKRGTKSDYKNGCRLILQSPLVGMRLDQISKDDIETTNFHESLASRDCAIRTLRRVLGKARDRKLIREVPRVKRPKVPGRERMVTDADEQQILPVCPRALQDVLIIMLDSGMRNGEVIKMRWEYIHWEAAFYFNPEGKTARARRQCDRSTLRSPIDF